MTERRLGVVVVGTGFGRRVHVPAARAAGLEVIALVGRDRARAGRRAARAGIAAGVGSVQEALRLPGSDIVVIATPPGSHAELAEEAIAAGRHVLVEKPFTTNAADAQRLVSAANKAGVIALVGHEFRFAPGRATLRAALREGLTGTPKIATFVGHSALAAPLETVLPAWWFDPAAGGGWLGASVSHIVDAIRCWLGEFDSISATLPMVSDRSPAEHAEDTAAARFRLRSGCEGILQHSAAVWGDHTELTRIAGPLGTLTLTGERVTLADATGTRPVDPAGPPLPEPPPGEKGRGQFADLELRPAIVQATILRDLVLGTPLTYSTVPAATFADGLACVEVLDAIRHSAATGGATIALP